MTGFSTLPTEKYVHSDKWIAIDNAEDTQYTYSAWVYSDNPQAQMFLFMKTDTEVGYATAVDNIVTDVKNSWFKMEQTVTVPAHIKKLNIRLDNNGSGNVWFDDVQIRKTSDPSSSQRNLNVSYDASKRPIEIEETNVDNLLFQYNDDNQRSIMSYGGFQPQWHLRPLHKFYSADGSMQVNYNRNTNTFEFITYIGGDGYSAPVVVKSNGTVPNYLYLHRDYQGSILAVSNDNGDVVEKRLFDAWGNIIKVQDGFGNTLNGLTVLDRGYTGHEHLQSIGLINMNARLYDPLLHRFLQTDNYIQDPSNTQNYNQYGYVLNNPLKYTDPSGDICEGCGGSPGVDGGGGTGISTDLGEFFRDTGIDQWARKNLNFANWDRGRKDFFNLRNRFGGKKSQTPPPNMSTYNIGSQLNNSPYSSAPKINRSFGNIQSPTQHSSFGFNWTYLSQGKFGERFIYEVFNGFSTTSQAMIGRSVGDYSMRNLDGSATTTDEAVWGLLDVFSTVVPISETKVVLSEVKTANVGWKVGSPITNLTSKGKVPVWSSVRQRFWKNEAFYNSSTYSERNLLRMRTGLAPQRLNPETGLMESMELHHHKIPQRNGGLFDFIKVWPDEHRAIDPFRK